MNLPLCFWILAFLSPVFSYEKNELEWLTETIHLKGEPMMVYVFLTTLPYDVTHPTPPSVPVPEPQPVPVPETVPESPVSPPVKEPNPQNSTKRSLSGVSQIGQNNTAPQSIPVPSSGVPSPGVPSSGVPQSQTVPNPVENADTLWLKSIFLPTVDHLSLFKVSLPSNVSTSNQQWYSNYPKLRAYVQIGNGTNAIQSSRKLYWATNTIIGSWSIMIYLSMGVVTSIEWDDGCTECDVDHCLDNVCALEPSTCSGTVCDMKFYVAFVGTDANGIYCTSAGGLPSNFETFSFGPIYPQAAKASYNSDLTILPTTTGQGT